VLSDAERLERWRDAVVVEPRPGLARWEVIERLEPTAARGLGIAGEAVIAARPWVEGRSLGRTATLSRWQDTAAAVAMTLRELHDQGRYHGALKPANIVMEGATSATITDLPLSPTPYDDPTRLASMAPYLAPECWEGEPPTPATDIYALGVMLCEFSTGRRPLMANGLSGWSKAHGSGAPRIEHLGDAGLTDLVDEMLSKQTAARPTADDVVQRLVELGADVEPPSISPLTGQIRAVADDCVQRLMDEGPTHLRIERRDQRSACGRIAVRVAQRLQTEPKPTILVEGPRPEPGWPWTDAEPPWSSLVEIARAVARLDGRNLKEIAFEGDRLHVERELRRLVLDQLPDSGMTVVWHSFDDEIADVRRFWRALVRRSVEAGAPLCTLTIADEPMSRAETVDIESTAAAWDTWRTDTARGDVRRMSSNAWREILSEGAPGLDAMQEALDRHLGNRRRSDSAQEEPSADPRSRVVTLIEAGAFDEASHLCREACAHDDPAADVRDELVALWARAARHVRTPNSDTEALERLLDERLRSDARAIGAAVDLARVRLAQDRPLEALQALNAAAPAGPQQRSSVLRWKAQANLDAGRLQDAEDAASEGLEQPDIEDSATERELELLVAAAAAANGDDPAAEQLALRLAEYGSQLSAEFKAQMYRCLGRSRLANARFDDAIDCFRRAVDIVSAAHIDAELPRHRLRLGNAYHRRGQLGLAREQYESGLERASESTEPETRALLHAQIARVDETLGALDDAERHLWRARDVADNNHLDAILVVCDLLEGELYTLDGEPARARECYQRALQGRRLTSPFRETELQLTAADASLQLDELDVAAEHVSAARDLVDTESLEELEPRVNIMRARVELARGEPSMSAIEEFRVGLEGALEQHDLGEVLRHAPALIEVLRAEGLDELIGEVVDVYSRARRSVSTGLTRSLREQFERHAPPIDTQAPEDEVETTEAATPRESESAGAQQFRRLLGFNELLFGATDPQELADASLEVLRALLAPECALVYLSADRDAGVESASDARIWNATSLQDWPGDATVALAREVSSIGQSTSVESSADPRFAGSSEAEHGLELAAWPIRDGDGVVGALVLGSSDASSPSERPLVEAVAHQIALATRRIIDSVAAHRRLESSEQARERLQSTVDELRADIAEADGPHGSRSARPDSAAPHASKPMEAFQRRLEQTATRQMPVELVGSEGARRETHARTVHELGERRNAPFIVVDCSAFDRDSLVVELFGESTSRYERKGALALADGGTLFLEGLDRAPKDVQSRLYRALESGSFRPVGAERSVCIDVRPIGGVSLSLVELVERGEFDANLGHWMSAERLDVPPLSERPDDVPLLAKHLLEGMSAGLGRELRLTAEAARVLQGARWPGDVRQLESVVRAAATLVEGETIGADTVATLVEERPAATSSPTETRGRKPKATRADVVSAMQRADDDRSRAAELLEVSERTLYRYLKKYELR
jgi:DNA-binding NtrC family response regulator/tetratricopeptide (TPR) repeat protein